MLHALIQLVPTCVHASLVPPVMESHAMVIIKHIKLKVREDMFIVISFYASCMYMKTGVLCGLYVLHDIYLLFYFMFQLQQFCNFSNNQILPNMTKSTQEPMPMISRFRRDVYFQTAFLVSKATKPGDQQLVVFLMF